MAKIQQLLEAEVTHIDHLDDDFFYQKHINQQPNLMQTFNQIKSHYEEKYIRPIRQSRV